MCELFNYALSCRDQLVDKLCSFPEGFGQTRFFYNPPNGSMGRHGSWKNHALNACRCVTTFLEADSRLLICRTRESKNMKETRDFLFLTPPCLSIEPLVELYDTTYIPDLGSKIRSLTSNRYPIQHQKYEIGLLRLESLL